MAATAASPNVFRTTANRVYVHYRWPLSERSTPFSPEILVRLSPYLTRYGQTLGASVFAVGGGTDHLHVLLDLPIACSPQEIADELQAATVRFLRGTLNVPSFAWHDEDGGFVVSCGLDAPEKMGDYLRQNFDHHRQGTIVPPWENADEDEPTDAPMPDWLSEAMRNADRKGK